MPRDYYSQEVYDLLVNDILTDREKITKALGVARYYKGTDGAHHKEWVLDQMVRALTGRSYPEFVTLCRAGKDGPETYDWDEGVAP